MFPEEVVLWDQEIKKFLIKVIDSTLKCGVLTLGKFDRSPLKYDVNTLHKFCRCWFEQSLHLFNHLNVLLEVCTPHQLSNFFTKDLFSGSLASRQVLRFEFIVDPFIFCVSSSSFLFVARCNLEFFIIWFLHGSWFSCNNDCCSSWSSWSLFWGYSSLRILYWTSSETFILCNCFCCVPWSGGTAFHDWFLDCRCCWFFIVFFVFLHSNCAWVWSNHFLLSLVKERPDCLLKRRFEVSYPLLERRNACVSHSRNNKLFSHRSDWSAFVSHADNQRLDHFFMVAFGDGSLIVADPLETLISHLRVSISQVSTHALNHVLSSNRLRPLVSRGDHISSHQGSLVGKKAKEWQKTFVFVLNNRLARRLSHRSHQ